MSNPEVKPVRCLIIQLGRLGDTLQSLMALRAAQQLYPQLEIHFIARESFSAAAKRIPWIKTVHTFPSEEILGPVVARSGTEREALRDLARWVRPLVQEAWDVVFNWTYSEASSYLMGLIPARAKLGYSRSKTVEFSCPDGWSHYIQAVVQGGILQNIHLTDVLTTQLLTALQIHVGEPGNNGDAPVTSKDFFSLESASYSGDSESRLGLRWRDRSKKWVALHIDSLSHGANFWADLIEKLVARNSDHGVLLIGGTAEAGEEILNSLKSRGNSANTVLSLAGKAGIADFDLYASAMSRAQWLISSEPASIHLASVLGTRVLALFSSTNRWLETGPYGNGHYVMVAPDTQKITPEMLSGVWSYALQDSSIRKHVGIEQYLDKHTSLNAAEIRDGMRVYRSRIRSSGDGGGVLYEPLNSLSLDLNDWTAMVMGHIARAWYCGWVPTLGRELSRASVTPSLVRSLRELQESAEVLAKICQEATLTATRLTRQGSKLRSPKIMRLVDKEELQALSKKLGELDGLIERMGRTQAPLAAFSRMSKVLMHNLRSTEVAELGYESAECYRQIQEGVTILKDWIKYTLDLVKPVAIKRESTNALSLVPSPSPKA